MSTTIELADGTRFIEHADRERAFDLAIRDTCLSLGLRDALRGFVDHRACYALAANARIRGHRHDAATDWQVQLAETQVVHALDALKDRRAFEADVRAAIARVRRLLIVAMAGAR